jgi:transcriptional regulator with XRE-family HTH domain
MTLGPVQLGERLRALRQLRGLSLADVAQATGLSPSFLSLVENAKSDISVGRLARIADALQATISDLVDLGAVESGPVNVVRKHERRSITSGQDGIVTEFVAPGLRVPAERQIMTFEPAAGVDLDDYQLSKPGESFFLILKGELLVELQDSPPLILRPGDTIALNNREFARSRCISREPTVVFVETLAWPSPA